MFKRWHLVLAAAAMAFCIEAPASAQEDRSMTPGVGTTSGSMMMAPGTRGFSWSRRYELTPLEHKRLRALGLTDEEVFAAANAARLSGVSLDRPTFDDPAQMLLRGRAEWQIARDLNVPATDLDDRRPEWQTAEWRQAVDEGWFNYSPPMTGTTSSTITIQERTRTTTEERR